MKLEHNNKSKMRIPNNLHVVSLSFDEISILKIFETLWCRLTNLEIHVVTCSNQSYLIVK